MVEEDIDLGHRVSANGLKVYNTKIEVTEKLPPPTNIKKIRSFLGHVGFYRCFIKDFSEIMKPLCSLLENNIVFSFNETCLHAFSQLRHKLVSARS